MIMKKKKIKVSTKYSKFFIFLLCLALTIIISYVQHQSGPELTLTLFYLFPIILAVWKAGIWAGIFISFIAALMWLFTDLIVIHLFSNETIPYFNATFRLIGFLIIIYIVSELKNALDTHKDLSRTDPLTSLSNKRAFHELSAIELNNANRFNHSFSVLCIDLDNFKEVNDTLGHNTGDILLKNVAGIIKKNIRKIDLAGRLGGDEFGIVFSRIDADSAYIVANKLRNILLDKMRKNKWPVTFSMGLATFQQPPRSVEEMIQKADLLMYAAKKNGKNMIKHLVIGE